MISLIDIDLRDARGALDSHAHLAILVRWVLFSLSAPIALTLARLRVELPAPSVRSRRGGLVRRREGPDGSFNLALSYARLLLILASLCALKISFHVVGIALQRRLAPG